MKSRKLAKPAARPFLRYLRDENRNPKGTVVVFRSNRGALKVGWSKCHDVDDFDKRTGLHTALRRAVPVGIELIMTLEDAPEEMAEFVRDTVIRADRFFNKRPAKPKLAMPAESDR